MHARADGCSGAGALSRAGNSRLQTDNRSMTALRIKAGPYEFEATMLEAMAPKTCARFASLLPYKQQIIHVR